MERYYDSCTDIPLEHAEVCAWDIAECELDEDTRKNLSTLTLTRGLAESTENAERATSTLLLTFTQTLSLTIDSHN